MQSVVNDVNFSYDGCRDDENASPKAALEFLAKHCQWAVVTLGSNECLAKWRRKVSAM